MAFDLDIAVEGMNMVARGERSMSVDMAGYASMSLLDKSSAAQAPMIWLSVCVWIILPIFVTICAFSQWQPVLPTCEEGFGNWMIAVVVALEAFYLYCENISWNAIKASLTRPEQLVMRQLGIFRKRKWLVLLGAVQIVDFWTDIMFPFSAGACGDAINRKWARTWGKVPVFGPFMEQWVRVVKYQGTTLLIVLLKVAFGIVGTFCTKVPEGHEVAEDAGGLDLERVSVKAFFAWARLSMHAAMPSVSRLCEAMTEQRKYKYDNSKDTKISTEARERVVFRHLTPRQAKELCTSDPKVKALVKAGAVSYYLQVLAMEVFVGNVLQLWIQSSFLMYAFDDSGPVARAKVVLSMACSTLVPIVFAIRLCRRINTNFLYCFALTVTALFMLWAIMKAYMAFVCESHIWNIFLGCE